MIVEFSSLKELFVFNIKYYRYMNKLSQEKISEMCSISSKYWTDIEQGKIIPLLIRLVRLLMPWILNLISCLKMLKEMKLLFLKWIIIDSIIKDDIIYIMNNY